MPPQTSMPGEEVRDGHSHQDLPQIRPLTSEIRWTETLVAWNKNKENVGMKRLLRHKSIKNKRRDRSMPDYMYVAAFSHILFVKVLKIFIDLGT